MSEDDDVAQKVLSDMMQVFQTHAFGADKTHADELSAEAWPVIQTLVSTGESYESQTMVTLLGRRLGQMQLSALTMSYLLPTITQSLCDHQRPLPTALATQLNGMCTEGYVRAVQEAQDTQHQEAMAESVPVVFPIPGCAALILTEGLSVDSAAEVADRFGRILLKKDAKSAIVDVSRVRDKDVRNAAIQHAVEATKMLGVLCVVVVSPLNQEEGLDADIDIYVKFSDALRAACRAEGIMLRSLPKMMRRFT